MCWIQALKTRGMPLCGNSQGYAGWIYRHGCDQKGREAGDIYQQLPGPGVF